MAVKGALIEYSGQFLGPVPNIVVFQFNPEQIARTLTMADSGAARGQRAQTERSAAAGPPTEEFTVTIQLSAAEDLGTPGPFTGVTRLFGIGPQIAALEKMVYPNGPNGLIGAVIDAVGSAISGPAGQVPGERSSPREALPRLLFIWGPTRVLPVAIKSMTITEQEYDNTLSPTRADVALGLKVSNAPDSEDLIALGALLYTRTVKEAQVIAQMARGITQLPSIIPF
jgi:hypothetical protein